MNRSLSRGLFFILAGSLLAGCHKPDSPVVAKVGGATVTVRDLQERLEATQQEAPAAYQQYVASEGGRREFLKLLIKEKVVYQEAQKSGLEREQSYKEAVKRFQEQAAQRLKDYKETLLIKSYILRLRSKELAVTDADVKNYFDNHAAEFAHPVKIQVSHILVNSESEATMALDRLKRGEPFEQVAREMSKDPGTAARGGQLNAITRGSLVPEFEEVAFRLKEGEVSGLVKTQFGFHIIKKTGQSSLPPRSFEEAKEEIRMRLERERFDQWVTRKQQELGTTVNEKAISAFGPLPSQEPSTK